MIEFCDLSKGQVHANSGISEFQQFKPSEHVKGPFKVWERNNSRRWNYDFHWKRPTAELNPIGFYKINNLIVTRPGGTMLTQHFGYHCATGRDNMRSIPPSDDYFASSSKNKIIIEDEVVVGDGVAFDVWGHWLVDYLPRFGLVDWMDHGRFASMKILLPSYAPGWVDRFLNIACNVSKENIIKYDPNTEIVLCKKAIVPSYCYTNEFSFHSFVKEFYTSLCPRIPENEKNKKLLVSRSDFSHSNRKFPNRELFEAIGRERGYEIILPEKLSLEDQIAIFTQASMIVGEHGSGMHSAVFSSPDTVIGCLGFWNAVQLHIGYLMGHQNVYLTTGCEWPTPDKNEFQIGCTEEDLNSFFDKMAELEPIRE